MALPNLRHFKNQGIFTISSDPVEALIGEAWVLAIYTDKGWATADEANLLGDVQEWRDVQKEEQVVQKRQAKPRQRTKSQKS